ncbi:MAG: hypothetical protein ACYCVV_14565 [Acidimicrobiales bacterium]
MTAAVTATTAEILRQLRHRRLRVNPRVIKRKMSKWPKKRAEHANPPRPAAPPRDTILIVGASRTESRSRGAPSPDSN